jgi:uncharacterized phage-associated protein
MATVHDVAAYILDRQGPMTAMKLQKLVYYCQAWSLVWDERPLFHERVGAWANGPVVVDLYQAHRGRYSLAAGDVGGDPSRLTADELDTVVAVLDAYGQMTAHQLSKLSHSEPPWRDARVGMGRFQRGGREITHAAMAEYFDGLVDDD